MNISKLKGKTLVSARKTAEKVFFTDSTGVEWALRHEQNCCESVWLEDVCGDLEDLVGSPLLVAEEVSTEGMEPLVQDHESFTWSFFKLATVKGYVTLRWYGYSNGYYSEAAELYRFSDGDWRVWDSETN